MYVCRYVRVWNSMYCHRGVHTLCQFVKFILFTNCHFLWYKSVNFRFYAQKKIQLDESRKTRTKEAVLKEARLITHGPLKIYNCRHDQGQCGQPQPSEKGFIIIILWYAHNFIIIILFYLLCSNINHEKFFISSVHTDIHKHTRQKERAQSICPGHAGRSLVLPGHTLAPMVLCPCAWYYFHIHGFKFFGRHAWNQCHIFLNFRYEVDFQSFFIHFNRITVLNFNLCMLFGMHRCLSCFNLLTNTCMSQQFQIVQFCLSY